MSDLLLGFIIYSSLSLLTCFLVVCTRRLNYWRRLGVSHSTAYLLFGNLLSHDSLANDFNNTFEKFCQTGEPFCGFFFFMEPSALILDKILALKILATDKTNFIVKTPSLIDKKINIENLLEANAQVIEYLSNGLLQLDGEAVNVNYFCNKYLSAVIALLFGVGIDDAPTTSNATLRKWIYAVRLLYDKSKGYIAKEDKVGLFKSLAIHRDVAASTLSYVLLQLALDHDEQQKVRAKMLEACTKNEKLDAKKFEETEFLDAEIAALSTDYTPYSHIILCTRESYATKLAGYNLNKNRLVIIPMEAFAKESQEFQREMLEIGTYSVEMLLVKAALLFILNKYNFDECKETKRNVDFEEILPHKVLKTKIYLSIRKREPFYQAYSK